MMIVAVMIFNMQTGFMLLELGISRKKFSRNVMIKHMTDTFVCSLAFYLVGYSFSINAQGGFFGTP